MPERRDSSRDSNVLKEAPISEEAVLLTRDGLKNLQDELHELRTKGRSEVAEQIREAQELGMAKVDGQYEDAQRRCRPWHSEVLTGHSRLLAASVGLRHPTVYDGRVK